MPSHIETEITLLQPLKDEDGKETSDDLSPQGYYRAANLHRVFGRGNTQPGYNTPDVIYAMKSQPVRPLVPAPCPRHCLSTWQRDSSVQCHRPVVALSDVVDTVIVMLVCFGVLLQL